MFRKATALFLFVLIINSIYGQPLSGVIVYKVRPPDHINQVQDTTGFSDAQKKFYLTQFERIKKTTPYLTYTLDFNSKEALFKRPVTMAIDNGMNLNWTAGHIFPQGIYYMNLESGMSLIQHEMGFKLKEFDNQKIIIVKKKLDSLNWDIKENTKQIRGYTCQKAEAESPEELSDIKRELTAWFCPGIPVQFGPKNISGLPGIILELEYRHFTLYADKIKVSKERNKKINPPTKGKEVTQKEFK